MGDAAHGRSPHISAGGTLGIEDVKTLTNALKRNSDLEALKAYETNRIPHYETVRRYSQKVEQANDVLAKSKRKRAALFGAAR